MWWCVAAAVAAVGAIVVVTLVGRPEATDPALGSVDWETPQPAAPDEGPSFDASDGEVFTTGQLDGSRWTAAVRPGTPPCIGVRLDAHGVPESASTCDARGLLSTVTVGSGEVLAVAGLVSDQVERLVWELPSGPLDMGLHDRAGLEGRVFAGAAPTSDAPTLLVAYDVHERQIASAGVPGGSR